MHPYNSITHPHANIRRTVSHNRKVNKVFKISPDIYKLFEMLGCPHREELTDSAAHHQACPQQRELTTTVGTYAKYSQYIDNYWTSIWSPIGSGWKFRTNFDHFSKWKWNPRLFGVFKNTETINIDTHWQICHFPGGHVVVSKKNKLRQAWNAVSEVWGTQYIYRNNMKVYQMRFIALLFSLYLAGIKEGNYIALAIVPSWCE